MKAPIFGNTAGSCAGDTPNHCASVAAYCTDPVVGTYEGEEKSLAGAPSQIAEIQRHCKKYSMV